MLLIADSLLVICLLCACSKGSADDAIIPIDPATGGIGLESPRTEPTPRPTAPQPSPIEGKLWVDSRSLAALDADSVSQSGSVDGRRLRYIADQPTAVWFGEWSGEVESKARALSSQAQGKILVLVAYHIPYRDCGSYSAGGAEPSAYRQWIDALARGLGSHPAIVILEPDALAQLDCLTEATQKERLELLRYAVQSLKKSGQARVYLDGGHSAWKSVEDMADRLSQAGVEQADGFALNVSNFETSANNLQYGQRLGKRLGNKNFVIDTSRNGMGPDPQGIWCNPSKRALGEPPRLNPGWPMVDALLWIKRPGESDGACNGGPAAGQWWRDMALGLAQQAGL